MSGLPDDGLVTFAREMLLERIAAARQSVWLVSPFLTRSVAERIRDVAERSPASERRLLTALSDRSVQVGVLDVGALSVLREAKFHLASIRNLHAKASIIDAEWGLVGSGNLTGSGLGGEQGGNVELGVTLSPSQVRAAAELVSGWWEKADPVDARVLESYASLPRLPRRPAQDGIGPVLQLGDTVALDRILAEDEATAQSRRYWIKSNYHRSDDEEWWHRSWISDWRQAPYEIGDLIVLYLSARDGGSANCPAVVRVTSPSVFNRQWVIEHRDAGAADKWPYVTKTALVAEVPIINGVPLSVAGKTGQSVQGGYCRITREEFERMAEAMRTASG